MDSNNVTIRNKNKIYQNKKIGDSEDSLCTFQSNKAKSSPDLSTTNLVNICELQTTIENLQSSLYSANQQIEKLILEKKEKEELISRQEQKINELISIGQTSSKLDKNTHLAEKLNKHIVERTFHINEGKRYKISKKRKLLQKLKTKKKIIIRLEKEIKILKKQNNKYNLNHDMIKNKKAYKHLININNTDDSLNCNIKKPESVKKPNTGKYNREFMPKLYILNSNIESDLQRIEDRFSKSYNFCQFRTPKANIETLLENIDKKLESFTMNDFCLIFLGESDFLETKNYVKLISHIQDKLQPLHHTNIILILPTYKIKYNTTLYNYRIETFNNLLYMNVRTNNYAYILDSNLTIDYDNYKRRNGKINSLEISSLMNNLMNLMVNIKKCNEDYSTIERHHESNSNISSIDNREKTIFRE